MMKFKLCYPLPGVTGTYIAPQLLSANQPDFPWEETDNLLLRYSYKFMPKGILTQLIVVMYAFIAEHRLVWKSGVVLSKDKTLAEIKEHYDRREIRIHVTGKHRKDLLVIAMHELDKIHASYPRLEYSKLVPCNCSVCKNNPEPRFYEFGVLRKFIEDRERIQCQESYEMVDVLGLVDDVVGREQLVPMEARNKSGFSENPRSPQFIFQGAVDKVVVTTPGERRDDKMAKPSRGTVKARSAWANGSFYLVAFVIVITAVGLQGVWKGRGLSLSAPPEGPGDSRHPGSATGRPRPFPPREETSPSAGNPWADRLETPASSGEAPADTGKAFAGSGEPSADSGEASAGTGAALTDGGEAFADLGGAFADTGEAFASSGEPSANSGEPSANSGEPSAGSGEPLANSGEAPAGTGAALTDGGEAFTDLGGAFAGSGERAACTGGGLLGCVPGAGQAEAATFQTPSKSIQNADVSASLVRLPAGLW
jgi:hypothetical protein